MSDSVEIKQSRKEQILHTATNIFCEKTYHGTTLQDIADAVGMLKGSLYYYITSKETLLADIMLDAVHALSEDLLRVESANLEPKERLRQIIREHVKYNAKYRESGTLFLTERHVLSSSTVMAELSEIFDRRNRLVASTLSEAIEMGIYRPVDVKISALAIVGLCNSIVFWFKPDDTHNYEEIADIFFNLVDQGFSVGH